ncbi:hypothetical protein CBL_04664 [Carabus blaptoides fortunei]
MIQLIYILSLFSITSCNVLLQSASGEVNRGSFIYWSLNYNGNILIKLISLSGDADLYISERIAKPDYEPDKYDLHAASCEDISFKTEWVKVPTGSKLTFVGRDVVCVGTDCHLIFYNLVNGEQHIYSANQQVFGDGVQCYTGHRQLPVLGFAEKCLNPRIIIISYPELHILRTLKGTPGVGYTALSFSDHEYLISLSCPPVFQIIVWNWRTQEKLVSKNTEIYNPYEIISCSVQSAVSVVQWQMKAKDFVVWDIFNRYKRCLLMEHNIQMRTNEFAINIIWSPEGGLFVLNNNGCVYMLNSEYKLDMMISGPGFGFEVPCFTWFKGGLIIAEPNLDIKHFKRSTGKWIEDWKVYPTRVTQLISSSGKDILIGLSDHGEIMEFDMNQYSFIVKKSYESNIDDLCFVNPCEEYFVTLSNKTELAVWECISGNKVGFIKSKQQIVTISSNPEYPYIATGFSSGTLELISIYNPEKPTLLARFKLYREEITKILFNNDGNVIVTANLIYGLFFIIQGTPGQTFEIVTYIDYRREIVDICITDDNKLYKLYLLVQHVERKAIRQRIVLKTVIKANNDIRKKKYLIPKKLYSHFIEINGEFYAVPQNSKHIHTFKIVKKDIKITNDVKTGHQMRQIQLGSNSNYLYTYGVDGLIIIQPKDSIDTEYVLMPHYRTEWGIRKMSVDSLMRYVISLGKNGTLVCTKIIKSNENRKEQIEANQKKLSEMESIFNAKTIGYEPSGADDGKTYLEMKEKELVMKQTIEYAEIRKKINDEFQMIKKEVVQLFEENLGNSDMKKIDILEFYLHTKLKNYKEMITETECELTVKYYKDLIRIQDGIWRWMKSQYWDTMLVKRKVIKGIFSEIRVENYTMPPEDGTAESNYKLAILGRETEELGRICHEFQPWAFLTESHINMLLEREPEFMEVDEKTRLLKVIENDEASDSNLNLEKLEKYPSSVAAEFVSPCGYLYQQEEVHTSLQANYQRILLQNQITQLCNFLNEKHEAVMQQKVRDMNEILRKNTRLKYILSEIQNKEMCIVEPVWHQSEIPESVITVQDHEIAITPYISPSEQALLDATAAEEERIRLLLLADDFRERALIKMMNGMLEVRWEDIIKQDIPPPKCVLEKEPENYNEDDYRAVKAYEEKVSLLKSERHRYGNMLEHEFAKLWQNIRDSYRHFNKKLCELLLLKIKVESARNQENLLIQRTEIMFQTLLSMIKDEDSFKEKIKQSTDHIGYVQRMINELTEASNECKYANEVLLVKEKQLDKNFKKDFLEYPALVQEQTIKLYKKHPKMSYRGINSPSLLNELATGCVTQEKSLLLTQECLDYLRSVDYLDQYIGVPNTIDETMYKIICRHRRLKIDNEIRLKANALDQSEIENAIQILQKVLTQRKETNLKILADLEGLREDKRIFMQNKELQIVIKQGLVEVKMTGDISDFQNAIMVNRKEVENINAIILKAGQLKLNVMNNKMIHRRSIIMKEWEHKKMNMEIADLIDVLHRIQNTKVTKEIQVYLKQLAKGESLDRGMTLNQEIELAKTMYERIISEKQGKIHKLDNETKKFKKDNKILDEQIASINVDVCEQQVCRDLEFEKKNKESIKKRMAAIVKRSKLVKQIQEQHNEILVLQTELELLRLKTYPTLKFKTLF